MISPSALLPHPETTVVTGAGGWLGTALLHALCDPVGATHRPGSVIAVVRHPDEQQALRAISPQITTVVADVTDPASLRPVFELAAGTFDTIHAAGVIHPTRHADFEAVNTGGTRNVIDACMKAGVRRLVHVSSNSPFGTNPGPRDTFGHHEPYHPYLGYGWSKMHAELEVLGAVERGLDAVIVRPPWFYGPWQPPRQTTFFKMVRSGRFPVFGAGDQRRSMVYIGNLVAGVLLAERSPVATGRGYWIADEQAYTVDEIVSTVRRALTDEGLTCSPRQLRVPVMVARAAERVDRLLQARGRYHQQIHVLGEMGHSIAVDPSAAAADLGYVPETSLYEGMRTSIRWCLDRGLTL